MVRPDGLVLFQRDPQVYTDDVDALQWTDNCDVYTRKIQTPWLAFGEIQGFRAVYHAMLIGSYRAGHQLHIDVEYDYVEGIRQSEVVDGSVMTAGRFGGSRLFGSSPTFGQDLAFSNYQFRINFNQKWVQAVRLTIWENSPTAAGAWSALTFSVGTTGKTKPIPRSNIMGGS
jgi:hypothetical protein